MKPFVTGLSSAIASEVHGFMRSFTDSGRVGLSSLPPTVAEVLPHLRRRLLFLSQILPTLELRQPPSGFPLMTATRSRRP